jgi:RHS repeat-associated protein
MVVTKRRFFIWALIVANALVQMFGAPPAYRAVAATSPQGLLGSPIVTPYPLAPPIGKLATPYPVLRPRRSGGSVDIIQAATAHLISRRIAGVSYAKIVTNGHLTPQAVGPVGTRVMPTSSQPGAPHLGSATRSQTISTRSASAISIRPMTVMTGTADPDGINRWWPYEEDAIGGVGKYLVNVATGNLVVQADDMAVSNKGIEFAFRRTYNSMSNHTYDGTDGSEPSLYGDKWTNTFDTHIAYNDFTAMNGQKGVSLYDIDGARYDYAPAGDGHAFTAPAGQFAVLYYDGAGYSWTKKSGTVYYFFDLNQPPSQAGLAGQIEIIYGRNHNNFLSFARSYTNGDASLAANLASMVVTAEDGRTVTLIFGDVSQNGSPTYRVLQSLTWPDGTTTVTFGYTVQFQGSTAIGPTLTQVTSPGNGSTTSGKINEEYNYAPSTALLTNVFSPRYYCSQNNDCSSAQNPIMSGPAYSFSYGSGTTLSQVGYFGDVNPSITDSTGSGYLKANATHDLGTTTPYRTVLLSYSSGSTTWSDTDNHRTVYAYDSVGRITQTTETTGDLNGGVSTLSTTAGWDSNNNLTFTTDPRGNETDYAYDNSGNTIAVALPSASTNVNGSLVSMRATSLYSYDANNNLTAHCDPMWVHVNGKDWVTRPAPSDSLCPNQTGTRQYIWNVIGSYEPFGEITQLTSPLGYLTSVSYALAQQGGSDYGLPTSVVGAGFTQEDGTNLTPQQTFTYDTHGDLICFSKGVGTWVLQYDVLNRPTVIGDPDDGSLLSCGKSSNSNTIVTSKTFFANGQLASSQTPEEAAAGVVTSYAYDADGDVIGETHHFGNQGASQPGTTQKYYDGADRLVEVGLPQDSTDFYSFPWLTRYLYDLTQGVGTVSFTQSTTHNFVAHGSMYKTQEFVNLATQWDTSASGSPTWTDLQGAAFDALDRQVALYKFGSITSTAYDATSSTLGLVSSALSQVGTATSNSYDAVGRLVSQSFSGGDAGVTPSVSTTYDPSGRIVSKYSAAFGTQTYTFDADGRLSTSAEPTGGSGLSNFPGSGVVNAPATLTYSYYPNGWRSALTVSSAALSKSNLLQYAYRTDGLVSQDKLNYGSTSVFGFTYSNAGRILTTSDPFSGTTKTYDHYGRLATYAIAAGTYDTYGYDPEGNRIGVHLNTSFNPNTFYHSFSKRNELVDRTRSANGYPVPSPSPTAFTSNHVSFSPLLAAQIGSQATPGPTPVPNPCTPLPPPFPPLKYSTTAGSIQYDAAGRQTDNHVGTTTKECVNSFWENWQQQNTDATRSYDALNHQVSQGTSIVTSGIGGTSPTYYLYERIAWGPNGHPLIIGTDSTTSGATPPPSYQIETLHWDGDQLLFTTNGTGQLDDIKVGALADYLPLDAGHVGLTVWDRDDKGQSVSEHNATGHDIWIVPDPNLQYQHVVVVNGSPQSGYTGQSSLPLYNTELGSMQASGPHGTPFNGMIDEPSADGITNEWTVFQGERTYSPDVGSWTTPDAYPGDIHDPASQKPFMYDRNNPISYSDPTGFTGTPNQNSSVPNVPIPTVGENLEDTMRPGVVDPDYDLAAMRQLFGMDAKVVEAQLMIIGVIVPGGPEVKAAEGVAEAGNIAVYIAVKDGKTIYVGITNNLERRAVEQLKNLGVQIRPIANGLSRDQARGVEQAVINNLKRTSEGGPLVNRINSIRAGSETYRQYVPFGETLLHNIGNRIPGFTL